MFDRGGIGNLLPNIGTRPRRSSSSTRDYTRLPLCRLPLTNPPVSAWMCGFGSGSGARSYGKHSGVICCYHADGCDDGGGDSESSIG